MDLRIPLGSEVQLPNSFYTSSTHPLTGILKFVGPVKGKVGTFAGVDLIGDQTQGKNNGSVDGVEYFKLSKDKSGLFLPYSKLVAANRHFAKTPTRPGRGHHHAPPQQSNSPHYNHPQRPGNSSPLPSSSSPMHSPLPSRPPFATRSISGPGSPSHSHHQSNLELQNRKLQDKNTELEFKLAKFEAELRQRTINLMDITKHFNELEKELNLRDAKWARQKQSYDQQRDELRDAVALLERQLQENQKLYHEELLRLSGASNADGADSRSKEMLQLKTELIEAHLELGSKLEEVKTLRSRMLKLELDNELLEKQLAEKDLQLAELSLDLETKLLETRLEAQARSEKLAATDKEIEVLRLELQQVSLKRSPSSCSDRTETGTEVGERSSSTIKVKSSDADVETLEANYKKELQQINEQHQLDLRQKQAMIDSLSRKVLELDNYRMSQYHDYDQGLQSQPMRKNVTTTPKSSNNVDRPSLKNIVNFHNTPPTPSSPKELHKKKSQPKLRKVASNITINESSISQYLDGELMVYIPETKLDPSAGREKWCGLCERQGHESVDCELF